MTVVYIEAHYGLRRSEALGLKWDCINFEEKTISINEVRVKYGKKVVVKRFLEKESSDLKFSKPS